MSIQTIRSVVKGVLGVALIQAMALEAGYAAASIRERLEQHRRDPACAVCHTPMDGL